MKTSTHVCRNRSIAKKIDDLDIYSKNSIQSNYVYFHSKAYLECDSYFIINVGWARMANDVYKKDGDCEDRAKNHASLKQKLLLEYFFAKQII